MASRRGPGPSMSRSRSRATLNAQGAAALTSTFAASIALEGHPTPSSETPVAGKHPPIQLVILRPTLPDELVFACTELAAKSVRSNVELVEQLPRGGPGPQSMLYRSYQRRVDRERAASPALEDEAFSIPDDESESPDQHWSWHIEFTRSEHLTPGKSRITASHDDFISLSRRNSMDEDGKTAIPGPDELFTVRITYSITSDAMRALGHILAVTRRAYVFIPSSPIDDPSYQHDTHRRQHTHPTGRWAWSGRVGELLERSEQRCFDTAGVMIDCSRNGVLLPAALEDLLRQYALLGINMVQLYTEDTYQIEDEPFFGYFRGPYTQDELRQIDDYAHQFGIEIIPCIQTLGHLGQILQWPQFGSLRDTHDVLLAQSEETYELIEKMITTVTAPLRSKRIHIGMDEANGIGEGRFRQLYGYQDPIHVFLNHLGRVREICQRIGVKPLIWSDMLFCLQAKDASLRGYYDSANPATPELVATLTKGEELDLVYWDYYHTRPEPYANKIADHWDLLQNPPWMANGCWTWSRFWCALSFTFQTIRPSMQAAKSSGVRDAMTTIWGDEGNECDIWSALPGIAYFAEHCYTREDEVDVELLKAKFDGVCGGDFDDFVYASKLDDLDPQSQPSDNKARLAPNMSKWLLWEDPFYSLFSPQYRGRDLETHYGDLANYLEMALSSQPTSRTPYLPPQAFEEVPANEHLQLPYLLSTILSIKCHLRDRLVHAYTHNNREDLVALAGETSTSRLSTLRMLIDDMHTHHRDLWHSTLKPFGWEALDLRYGGLKARLSTMQDRISRYLDDDDADVKHLPELEAINHLVYPHVGPALMLDYHRVSKPQYV
ncbi:glycoside hydrolase family 20 protein [Mixia osmundae IAM 14324]|uniref:beta-N-acetylhexosaminidase n=1 Tax=Mixia osmundae (strain CBS 9802 / IAM 14324 / JCM 22182 / KY 12970) TaxID=764103 RepID=G7E260_MIXOS|nr:glycoside hydrolase family 20 protein [Mixia osmundae IAM 14324]KEI36792.1 glycoside hydrolase family 20 protein [Mixia osmundae IAM 14324]GAA96920.1 hypothetical protein E5Q_03594 [Mixia osmundae IAM 14324]